MTGGTSDSMAIAPWDDVRLCTTSDSQLSGVPYRLTCRTAVTATGVPDPWNSLTHGSTPVDTQGTRDLAGFSSSATGGSHLPPLTSPGR